MFAHNKLMVHEKALPLSVSAEDLCSLWAKQHTVVDHIPNRGIDKVSDEVSDKDEGGRMPPAGRPRYKGGMG